MNEQTREKLIANMTDNLPVLRKKLDLTQEEFAMIIGVDRSTVAAIETHKRAMSWSLFLASLMHFQCVQSYRVLSLVFTSGFLFFQIFFCGFVKQVSHTMHPI